MAYGRDDRDIEAQVGEEFVIELDANPTTGYEWELVMDESKVRLLERELTSARPAEADSGRAAIGAGGAEEFKFKVLEPGDFEIRLRYGRAWESRPIEELTFRVHTKGS